MVRLRNGAEADRLALKPLFGADGVTIQRWPRRDTDPENISPAVVARRPQVRVMNLADYDHDGRKTEFYLQTEALPCGKSYGVVVGVSKSNPHLHVFGTASHPRKPLHMQKREWDALAAAQSGPVDVVDWTCGDHGSETETTLHLEWSPAGISGTEREYACPAGSKGGKPVRETPLGENR